MTIDLEYRIGAAMWTSAMARRWGSTSLDSAARAVASQLIGVGNVLPLASFAGGRVFPIVAWHIEALYRRAEFGWSPLLSPSRVHEVLDDRRRREAIPSALTILGFVGVSPLPIARRELSGLRSMARTIAMVPSTTRAHRLTLAEFDAQGTAVVELEGDDARVLVGGDSGARQGSGMSPVWHRFYEEQLLDWAVRTDSLPSYVMEPQAPRKSG